jgi:hypothetical protein
VSAGGRRGRAFVRAFLARGRCGESQTRKVFTWVSVEVSLAQFEPGEHFLSVL